MRPRKGNKPLRGRAAIKRRNRKRNCYCNGIHFQPHRKGTRLLNHENEQGLYFSMCEHAIPF